MFLQSWWNSYYILQPAFATSLFDCISLNTRFDSHIDARLLFTLSWSNSSNRLFHHFSKHSCVASHLLHFFQPFQYIFHPFANLSLTASARNILSQWLFWGSTSNSTQSFIQHRCFFSDRSETWMLIVPVFLALAATLPIGPGQTQVERQKMRTACSPNSIHLVRSLQSSISCWQDATLDDVTSTLGRDQFFVYTLFGENQTSQKVGQTSWFFKFPV